MCFRRRFFAVGMDLCTVVCGNSDHITLLCFRKLVYNRRSGFGDFRYLRCFGNLGHNLRNIAVSFNYKFYSESQYKAGCRSGKHGGYFSCGQGRSFVKLYFGHFGQQGFRPLIEAVGDSDVIHSVLVILY